VEETVNRRGRRPDPAVDQAIREAVLGLLFERGFEMTFDEVAARAGVGRASVFRRYPTKQDMIRDTIAQATVARIDPPDTGSLRADLVTLVTQVMQIFGEPRLGGFARRFVGAVARDATFTELFRANMDRRLELFTTVLDRAVERGELPASTDARLIADLVSGLLVFRLVADQPLPDAAEVETLVDGLLYGLTVRTVPSTPT
jgi:AcrR family transcriptional regulator